MSANGVLLIILVVALAVVIIYDLVQRKHSILRNFPLVGHFRHILEAFGPELRQYIVTGNEDEKPFTRNQRRWIYSVAKEENPYFGFGTDIDLDTARSHVIIKQAAFGLGGPTSDVLPCSKVWGEARGRRLTVRPSSAVMLSGMSYGALSGRAVEALNTGAGLAKCWQNTGEGAISDVHRHGGSLVYQVGTGYFGCRNKDGSFDLAKLVDVVGAEDVKAVEIKLSQGAKPGVGGVLPGAKVTPQIAAMRGVEVGKDCISPATHSAFSDTSGLLDFVELIADATGLPVGIKTAVGQSDFFYDLAAQMQTGQRGIDFLTIDGGEGGTGAGPLSFVDHVSLPFFEGFSEVYRIFAEAGLDQDVVFVGSGKLGFGDRALLAFALGVDMVAVGREAMLALGCVQAQRCHTGRCPSGVATQSPWLARGLDPQVKSVRVAAYICALRAELVRLARVCGQSHPALVTPDDFELLHIDGGTQSARQVYHYPAGLPQHSAARRAVIDGLMH